MARVVLGLDIGGANLKAATSGGRALSVPFKVWQHPDKLSAELAKLIRKFPEATEIAATMTAELCDCYETKREGVRRIVHDLKKAARTMPVRIWSTDGIFVSTKNAIVNCMKVAAANWHGLATFAARYVDGPTILLDIGTTTTDLIPIIDGQPCTIGKTDYDRMDNFELLYTGWRRTPATAILGIHQGAAEFFATAHDAHLVLGHVKSTPNDRDTADGRPATKRYALARIARMSCCEVSKKFMRRIIYNANTISRGQAWGIRYYLAKLQERFKVLSISQCDLLLSGSGMFLGKQAIKPGMDESVRERLSPFRKVTTLESRIGPELNAVAPAYALAVLASERPR